MLTESLRNALERGDIDGILGEGLPYLYPSNSDRAEDMEAVKAVRDYLYVLLEPIAKAKNIKPQKPETLINQQKYFEKAKNSLQNSKNDEYVLNKITNKLNMVYNSLGSGWIYNFIVGERELNDIFSNPQLKSETSLLLESWKEADKRVPLDIPQKVLMSDDWEDVFNEDKYRLETSDEVQTRIAETKKARYEALKMASTIDHEAIFKKWWSFVNYMPETKETINEVVDKINEAQHKQHLLKLDGFKKDEKFFNDVLEIMQHDSKKHRYLYHGTQDVEAGYSIVKQGLLMANKDLGRTAYSEFTAEQLLTYSRGFDGAIGEYGVVIIDQPLNDQKFPLDIVEKNNTDISVLQSGLGGFEQDKLKYIVPSKYIVGYVDKHNHKVVKNPEYYKAKMENDGSQNGPHETEIKG